MTNLLRAVALAKERGALTVAIVSTGDTSRPAPMAAPVAPTATVEAISVVRRAEARRIVRPFARLWDEWRGAACLGV